MAAPQMAHQTTHGNNGGINNYVSQPASTGPRRPADNVGQNPTFDFHQQIGVHVSALKHNGELSAETLIRSIIAQLRGLDRHMAAPDQAAEPAQNADPPAAPAQPAPPGAEEDGGFPWLDQAFHEFASGTSIGERNDVADKLVKDLAALRGYEGYSIHNRGEMDKYDFKSFGGKKMIILFDGEESSGFAPFGVAGNPHEGKMEDEAMMFIRDLDEALMEVEPMTPISDSAKALMEAKKTMEAIRDLDKVLMEDEAITPISDLVKALMEAKVMKATSDPRKKYGASKEPRMVYRVIKNTRKGLKGYRTRGMWNNLAGHAAYTAIPVLL